MCIFPKIQLFPLMFFSPSLPHVKITSKILKTFRCLTLICNKMSTENELGYDVDVM
jgi:hypothetical protein